MNGDHDAIERGETLPDVFPVVQDMPLALDPRVGIEAPRLPAHTDPEIGGNPLVTQEERKHQRSGQTAAPQNPLPEAA